MSGGVGERRKTASLRIPSLCRTRTGTSLFLLFDDVSALLFLIESLADIAYAAVIDFGNVTSRDASGTT